MVYYDYMKRRGKYIKSKYPLETRIDGHGYEALVRIGRKSLIFLHTVKAEKALGKPLPEGVEVHHHNEIRSDNRDMNLVICEDRTYHCLLHTRMRAKEACGDPKKRKCKFCKQYDDVCNLFIVDSNGRSHYHPRCEGLYQKAGRERRKLERAKSL